MLRANPHAVSAAWVGERLRKNTMQKILATAGLLVAMVSLAGAQSIFTGSNLIQNHSAEAGANSTGSGRVDVPSWVGQAGIGRYDDSNWEIPSGSWSDGVNFFHGGNVASNVLTQTISVFAGDIAAIDAGQATFAISGWFGGWSGQDDNATLVANFRDANGVVVGSSDVLGGFLAADRGGVSSLLFDRGTGTIAVGTRSIEFVLTSTRIGSGTYNDGVADNLQFAAVPEPFTMSALALGLAAIARKRARKS